MIGRNEDHSDIQHKKKYDPLKNKAHFSITLCNNN